MFGPGLLARVGPGPGTSRSCGGVDGRLERHMADGADRGEDEPVAVAGGKASEALRADQKGARGGSAKEPAAAAAARAAILGGNDGHL